MEVGEGGVRRKRGRLREGGRRRRGGKGGKEGEEEEEEQGLRVTELHRRGCCSPSPPPGHSLWARS